MTAEQPADAKPLIAMMRYRGYKTVDIGKAFDYRVVMGSGQTDAEHPRPASSVLALFDPDPSFRSSALQRAIRILYAEALRRKLSPDSSIVFVYSFQRKRMHLAQIEKSYTTVLSEYPGQPVYYFEDLPIELFQRDWSSPRSTRLWRLRRESAFVLVYDRTGKPVIVDKPPMVMCESPEIKYLGGRPDDYVSFERLESLEVGPMWAVTMRRIGKRVEARVSDTDSATAAAAGAEEDEDR